MIANDPLALTSPDVARAVSDLLQSSVVDGTLSSYNSGFNSLVSFCRSVGQPAMPVPRSKGAHHASWAQQFRAGLRASVSGPGPTRGVFADGQKPRPGVHFPGLFHCGPATIRACNSLASGDAREPAAV